MRVKRSRKAVVAASIALVLVGGAAFAYWAMSGSGTISVDTKSGQALKVTSKPIGPIAPGDAIDLSGQIHNPNTTSVKLGVLSAALGNTAGIDATEFVLGGTSNSDAVVIPGGATIDWSGLTLNYTDSTTVNQNAGMGVTVDLIFTISPYAELAQINVTNWDRSVPIDASSVAKGRLTLLGAQKIIPANLGEKVATLTTTVETDAATASVDFNLVASGFISRASGETIARSTLFTPAHDGDPLLYAQDNSGGTGFCWDDKFYVADKFVFTNETALCKGNDPAPLGSTNTYITKLSKSTVTTEVIHDGKSMGTLSRDLPKDPSTQYQPILRTSLTAPAAGVTGALTISNTSLTIQ